MTESTRRSFLQRAGLLLLSLGAAGLGLWRLTVDWRARRGGAAEPGSEGIVAGGPAAQIEAALRAEFEYLQIEPAAFRRYARDYLADRSRGWRPGRPLPERERLRFLMSTDFFQNQADEARTVAYVAYYQPYASPCYNPFARLVDEGSA